MAMTVKPAPTTPNVTPATCEAINFKDISSFYFNYRLSNAFKICREARPLPTYIYYFAKQ